jgi:hypothetical protein
MNLYLREFFRCERDNLLFLIWTAMELGVFICMAVFLLIAIFSGSFTMNYDLVMPLEFLVCLQLVIGGLVKVFDVLNIIAKRDVHGA